MNTTDTDTPPEEDPPQEKHLLWKAFFQKLPLRDETCMFILIGMMDYFMTLVVLNVGGLETNPVANWFLDRWGTDGLLLLKILTLTFVVLIVQVIAVKNLAAAKRLLTIGSIAVGGVVLYTVMLIMRQLS